MKEEITTAATGAAGIGGIEVVTDVLTNVSPLVQLLVQIGIGIVTLFGLLKKKKKGTETPTVPYKND